MAPAAGADTSLATTDSDCKDKESHKGKKHHEEKHDKKHKKETDDERRSRLSRQGRGPHEIPTVTDSKGFFVRTGQKKQASQYIGVTRHRTHTGKWTATLKLEDAHPITLGIFDTQEEAARAFAKAVGNPEARVFQRDTCRCHLQKCRCFFSRDEPVPSAEEPEAEAEPEDVPPTQSEPGKRRRLVLVRPKGTDSLDLRLVAAAAAAAIPAPANFAQAAPQPREAAAPSAVAVGAPTSSAVNIRVAVGNTCERMDENQRGTFAWSAFVDIGPRRASWVEQVVFEFNQATQTKLTRLVVSEPDHAGIFMSPSGQSQDVFEVRIEVHWKPEYVEKPRLTPLSHLLNFELGRAQSPIIYVPARVPVPASSSDVAVTGDVPARVPVPASSSDVAVAGGSASSTGRPKATSVAECQSKSPGERLHSAFSELFRAGLLANPSQAFYRCQRLREAGEENLPIGPVVISPKQAEAVIHDAVKALQAAGHAVPGVLVVPAVATEAVAEEVRHEDHTATDVDMRPPGLRSALRPPRPLDSSSRPRDRQRHHASFDNATFEEIKVMSFKAAELWFTDSGKQVFCDDCGTAAPLGKGKLHGDNGLYFSRDTFSCDACLLRFRPQLKCRDSREYL